MKPTQALAPHALPPLYSRARRWNALRGFVLDAVADAMHHQAAMHGARLCNMNLLLSRHHLDANHPPEGRRQLDLLSGELRRLGIAHAIHCVVPGDAEPEQHQLRITLQTPPTP